MNTIQLIGNLCKDVEVRYSASNKAIVENILGVRKDKKSNGQYESDFIRIVLFDHNAEFISKYAKKGDRLGIVGKLRVDNYQDKEGNYKTSTYVVVDKMELLTPKKEVVGEKVVEVVEPVSKEKVDTSNIFDITDEDLPF